MIQKELWYILIPKHQPRITSPKKWNPETVDFKIIGSKNIESWDHQMVHAICTNEMYPHKREWLYDLPMCDEALLHSINRILARNVKEVFYDERFEDVKPRLNGKFATDTLWSKVMSLNGNKTCQIYSHKCGFKVVYSMMKANGENVGNTLSEFVHDYGAPSHLTFDVIKEVIHCSIQI